MRRTLVLALIPVVTALSPAAARAQEPPPKAVVREVSDTFFGQTVVDPYRWMENSSSPEFGTWMKAQADYTRAYLDRLPLRKELLDRLSQLSDAGVRVSGVQRMANGYFYYRLAPGENDRRLYVREGLNGAERLLVDPQQLSSPGKRYSINSFSPSLDGRYVAYTISVGGSEMGELRVLETATGKDMGERIDRVRFGAGTWLPDGRTILYNRLQKLPDGAPRTDLYQKSRVYRHVLGTKADDDRALFGYEVNPEIHLPPELLPFGYVPLGSSHAFIIVNSGVSPNSEVYVAPLADLERTPVPWRRIASLDDDVAMFDIHGDDLYLLTYKDAARYKVTRVSLASPDPARAAVVFPAGEAVVTGLGTARDALYVQTLDGGARRLWRVPYPDGPAQPVQLPYDGAASIAWTDQQTDGLLFELTSWTRSPAFFAYEPRTRAATNTQLVPPIPVDMSSIEATTVRVKSHDGVMVPLVILHRRGLKRDGAYPTLLDGYGAYGNENTSPQFAPSLLAWLERGGVFALAGVRGGGEYGEEWHLAGKGATKPNTWKDFIACAEYLVAQQYTSPAHLSGIGGSAGGILIGNAIAERPELFAAVVDQVGVNNALRAETTANGVPNIPEFGSVKTEEGFRALLGMDAYTKIRDGVKYPAVLLTTGINDPRVEPWMSAKMAARLQAASTSGKPILLRVDYDAGHGMGSTKKQRNEEMADAFAFLFAQLGGPRAKGLADK